MKLVKRLKEFFYEKKAINLMSKGDFEKALEYIQKISSFSKQKDVVYPSLIAYSIRKLGFTKIEFTQNKDEFERFQALVGPRNRTKYVFYINQEENIEKGAEELLKEAIPDNDPLLKYFQEINI